MQSKGQIEIIAILVFVIIGVLAAYFVLSPEATDILPGVGQTEQSKLIRDSVMNLVRTATIENINRIYDNGGYLDGSQVTNVEYGGLTVPVWQACSNNMAPDVKKQLENGIRFYITENLENNEDFYGKGAEFDIRKMVLTVNIFDGRVDVDAELPTKVEGNPVSSSYKTSVPSDIYQIVNFANDFVSDVEENRFFEIATLSTLVHFDIYSGPESESWMPSGRILPLECGRKVLRTRDQMFSAFREVLSYTISHVMWNAQPISFRANPFYPINSAGGNAYNLDVEFAYPNSWDAELERKFSTNPPTLLISSRNIFPLVPACMGYYKILYSFQYPVIVSVKDDVMGKYFRFAIYTSVKDSKPDDTCVAGVFSGLTDYEKDCVYGTYCDYNITVVDSEGNPIEGAEILFYQCPLGSTDENGSAVSTGTQKAPCIAADFQIWKEGYRTFGEFLSSTELEGFKVNMKKSLGDITTKLYGIGLTAKGETSEGVYTIYETNGYKKKITEFKKDNDPDVKAMIYFYPFDPNYVTGEDIEVFGVNMDIDTGQFTDTLSLEGLYPGDFYVVAVAIQNSTNIVLGTLSTELTLEEGDNSLFVYLPVVTMTDSGNPPATSLNASESSKLQGLSSCIGGSLISRTELGDATVGCEF